MEGLLLLLLDAPAGDFSCNSCHGAWVSVQGRQGLQGRERRQLRQCQLQC